MPAFTQDDLDNPFIYEAVLWVVNERHEAEWERTKAIGKQITLLDALATMLAPTLLKDGDKIAKVGMLAHLESKKPRRTVIEIDEAKIPDPSQMTFV